MFNSLFSKHALVILGVLVSATSLYSPTQSVSKESGSISNKFISIGLNEIVSTSFNYNCNRIKTIISSIRFSLQILPQFISKYTENYWIKDIEQFMTVMGSILTYERVDLRMSS
ncbi:hypothetical protein ENUP19_0161G0014 [Entamoeba nuttalli]|uniref:Uncharacterized protein n=1 Tax=Entamoeba nuttalli TaxID=412467 RepID=A0ABQ0DLK3_9EUKA